MGGERVFLQHNDQVMVGADYQVTENFDHLLQAWGSMPLSLGDLPNNILRTYLGKIVFATEKRHLGQFLTAEQRKKPGPVKCLDSRGSRFLFPPQVLTRIDTKTGAYLPINNTSIVIKPEVESINVKDLEVGTIVKICSDMKLLKESWVASNLEATSERKLRDLLRSRVKVESVQGDGDIVTVRKLFGFGDAVDVPSKCLLPIKDNAKSVMENQDKKEEIKKVERFEDIIQNRKYRVTDDVDDLVKQWEEFDLDRYIDVSYFKGKEGRCVDVDEADQTVKLSWSTEEEWFPWCVLSLLPYSKSFSRGKTSWQSSDPWWESSDNNYWHSYTTPADVLRQQSHLEYISDTKAIVIGTVYRITGSIKLLEESWTASRLPTISQEDMKKWLDRECRALQVDFSDNTVQCRFTDTLHDQWLPSHCLKILVSAEGDESQQGLAVGDIVRLRGVMNPEYLDVRGQLVEYLPQGGAADVKPIPKWRVRLLKFDRIVRVQSRNLEKDDKILNVVTSTGDVTEGDSVEITDDVKMLQEAGGIDRETALVLACKRCTVKDVNLLAGTVQCTLDTGNIESIPATCLVKV